MRKAKPQFFHATESRLLTALSWRDMSWNLLGALLGGARVRTSDWEILRISPLTRLAGDWFLVG